MNPMSVSDQSELVSLLQKDTGLSVLPSLGMEKIREALIHHINELIRSDFDQLVTLLYRIDVDEKKIRYLLKQEQGSDSAPIIADLILERQLRKIETRKQFPKKEDIPDPDKW